MVLLRLLSKNYLQITKVPTAIILHAKRIIDIIVPIYNVSCTCNQNIPSPHFSLFF